MHVHSESDSLKCIEWLSVGVNMSNGCVSSQDSVEKYC